MSEEPSGLEKRWPLLLGAVALLGVAVWWLLRPDPPRPGTTEASPEEGEQEAGPSAEGAAAEPAEPAEPGDYDPDRLARMLLDGGTAAQAEEAAAVYAPEPPTRGVEEPEAVAAERMRAQAEAAPPEPAPTRPGTPEQQLSQATFWRGMIDSRVAAMREQLATAQRAGDRAAVARAQRLIAQLEAQRPAIDRRIEALEGARGGAPDSP